MNLAARHCLVFHPVHKAALFINLILSLRLVDAHKQEAAIWQCVFAFSWKTVARMGLSVKLVEAFQKARGLREGLLEGLWFGLPKLN